MSILLVTILTPRGVAFEGEVSEAYFPTTQGPLGILPGHTPYVAVLARSGVIRLQTFDKKKFFFAVHYGAVEVRPDKTVALSEDCQSAPTLEDAEKLLSQAPQKPGPLPSEVEHAQAALASAYGKGEQKSYNSKVNK